MCCARVQVAAAWMDSDSQEGAAGGVRAAPPARLDSGGLGSELRANLLHRHGERSDVAGEAGLALGAGLPAAAV